ncbi:MAG: 50S ribosomal protein L23 [Actinobacteria bacterium]|nr:50S ribosomal protein L23 [Actinomycetota bacterium]
MYEGKPSSASPSSKAADGKKATEDKKDGKRKYGNAYKVLVKPLVTEKASVMGTLNKYFFAVAIGANKIEIAKAVQDVYGVKPISVNIIRMQGKSVRHGRTMGKRKDWKKAIVTLKKGESIKVYEGV